MAKITDTVWKTGIAILLLFGAFVGLFLTFYSVGFSYMMPMDYSAAVYLMKDSILKNLLVFGAVSAVSVLLNRLFRKLGWAERLAGYLFLTLCCILYVTICLCWLSKHPYYPSGDQLNATACAYYDLKGNFSMFCTGGYIGKYPFQKGLVLMYELFFTLFGYFCYPVVARFHVILGVITMIFGYLFVEETAKSSICKILYCPLLLFCAPYLILTPYAYGDLPSICYCTVLFWAMLRFSRTLRVRYVVLACCMGALSLMMRTHTWILLIAVMIGMALLSLQRRKLKPLLAGCLIVACAFCTIKTIDLSYEIRSGYHGVKGSPMILHIAMGLQDTPKGPGVFNNYQTRVLEAVDYDVVQASQIGRENIAESLERFRADRAYTSLFFKTKLLQQWIDPSFETLRTTYSFAEGKPIPRYIHAIYFGDWHSPLIRFCDRYQSTVYLGFLIFVLSLVKQRRKESGFYIPLITIVGGFLFSIIWESQCRYVLPYFMFMLLYVPEGICATGALISRTFQYFRKNFRKKRH